MNINYLCKRNLFLHSTAGIFGILKQLLHLSTRVRKREEEREEEQLRQSPTQTILNCFMLGWFIIGMYT